MSARARVRTNVAALLCACARSCVRIVMRAGVLLVVIYLPSGFVLARGDVPATYMSLSICGVTCRC